MIKLLIVNINISFSAVNPCTTPVCVRAELIHSVIGDRRSEVLRCFISSDPPSSLEEFTTRVWRYKVILINAPGGALTEISAPSL